MTQIIATTGVLCVAVIFFVVFQLPLKQTLSTADEGHFIKSGTLVNLPCSIAHLDAGTTTEVKTKVTGKGFAQLSHLFEDEQVKLHIVGLVNDLTCEVFIKVAPNSSINLPSGMTFIARNGVIPTPSSTGSSREFTRSSR